LQCQGGDTVAWNPGCCDGNTRRTEDSLEGWYNLDPEAEPPAEAKVREKPALCWAGLVEKPEKVQEGFRDLRVLWRCHCTALSFFERLAIKAEIRTMASNYCRTLLSPSPPKFFSWWVGVG
jgi:hypothetical protein